MSRNTLVTALLIGLAGCGGSSGSTNNPMETPPDMAQAGPDLAPYDPGPYPPGPWGVDEGDTIFNLKAKGYMLSPDHTDANELTFEEIAIEVMRRNPQCKCLMVSLAATWCPPCNAEQPELVEAISEDPSFCVYSVLVDGPVPGKRPTPEEVLDWNVRHGQNFPVVGANISTYAHLPTPDKLPTNVAVRPETMKILAIGAGLGPRSQGGLDINDAKELCAAAAP